MSKSQLYKLTRNLLCCLSLSATAEASTTTYLAPNWQASNFLTLSTPSRAIEFDSELNLYIEEKSDDGSGTIIIEKLDAASGYTSSPPFFAYDTGYYGATSLDFDGSGNLYVAERGHAGNDGIIRKIDTSNYSMTDIRSFDNQRPTGIDALNDGTVLYTGRRESDPAFGNVYEIDTSGNRTVLIPDIVGTGIAMDQSGRLFISTPDRDDLALAGSSIYMYETSDTDFSNPILIATFDSALGVEELTFDDFGNLYMIDNISNTQIVRLSQVPLPAAVWLFLGGFFSLLGLARQRSKQIA